MTSREGVLAALHRKEADRVPYCEPGIDRSRAQRVMGWGEPVSQASNPEANVYTVEEAKALAAFLHLDNICDVLRAPVYAKKHAGQDGRLFYGQGLIKGEADLLLLRLPDPHDDALYADAERFARQQGAYASWLVTRIGLFPTMLSLGTEHCCLALYDNRPFVQAVLDRYCDWIEVVAERVCQLGFDVFVSTDDLAFNTGPFFSPAVFRELVLPGYQWIAKKITLPWIIHSDGNVLPLLDDLLTVGIAGLHPNEKGANDIRAMKRNYGDRLCLLGNVDPNLLVGQPEAVDWGSARKYGRYPLAG